MIRSRRVPDCPLSARVEKTPIGEKPLAGYAVLASPTPTRDLVPVPTPMDHRAVGHTNRLRLRERRLGYHECRSLGPSSALEGIADGNGRKSRVPAIAEVRRKFGNRVARMQATRSEISRCELI